MPAINSSFLLVCLWIASVSAEGFASPELENLLGGGDCDALTTHLQMVEPAWAEGGDADPSPAAVLLELHLTLHREKDYTVQHPVFSLCSCVQSLFVS